MRWRRFGRAAVGVLGVLGLGPIALFAGWMAMMAMAEVSDRPALILPVALLGCVVVLGAGGWLLTRLVAGPRRRPVQLIAAGTAVVLLLGLVYGTVPTMREPATPAPPADSRYWLMPDGTRLAALSIPAAGERRGDPVVFLHGGPGVADLAYDGTFFGHLADTGRDIWLYDQIGAGHSDRLADPTGYSLDRDLADLAEVQRRIGADRLVLIGFSYGATLAVNYLARHPDRVAKLILISPGRLVPEMDDLAGTGMVDRLSARQRRTLLAKMIRPRVMVTWGLNTVNPRAAHAFAGDREMDARFAEVYQASAPGLVCEASDPPPTPAAFGFYANQVPLFSEHDYPDIRPILADLATPALVVKGGCDYLPWSFVQDYRRSLPDSQLIYFDDAGHVVHSEVPERLLAVMTAFLADSSLPVPPYPGQEPPPTYRGAT